MDLKNLNFDDLPEYRQAVEKECEIRADAFIPDLREFICGVEVLPLTFDHLNRLRGVRSPFICGSPGLPHPAEVAKFIWCVSPEYQAANAVRNALACFASRLAHWLFHRLRLRFIRRVASLDYAKSVAQIDRYMAEAHQDSPGSEKGAARAVSFYSGQTAAIGILSSEFHWAERDILRMPIKRVFQYLRWLEKRSDRNAILFNPSDKVRREVVERLKQQ